MMRRNFATVALRLSALALPLVWSTLTPASYAQTTPAGNTPTATGGATAAADVINEPTPGVGEIRLDGKIREVNAAARSFILDVAAFTLTSGKTNELTTPKPRTILINDQSVIHPRGTTQRIGLAELKAGVPVSVVGTDVGTGKDFPAREVTVNEWTVVQSPTAMGNPTGNGGTMLSAADVNRMLAAQRQELMQQIAALRTEIQQMKAAGAGATPAQPGGAQPNNQNTISRAEMNDLIAALNRQFSDQIKKLSATVDQLKAAQPAPAVEPDEEVPAEEAPAEEAPAEEAPAEEAPAEEVPAEEAPAEEVPAEEAPADDEKPAAPAAPAPKPRK